MTTIPPGVEVVLTALCFTLLLANGDDHSGTTQTVLSHLLPTSSTTPADATATTTQPKPSLLAAVHVAWTDLLDATGDLVPSTSTPTPTARCPSAAFNQAILASAVVSQGYLPDSTRLPWALDRILVHLGISPPVLAGWFDIFTPPPGPQETPQAPPLAASDFARRFIALSSLHSGLEPCLALTLPAESGANQLQKQSPPSPETTKTPSTEASPRLPQYLRFLADEDIVSPPEHLEVELSIYSPTAPTTSQPTSGSQPNFSHISQCLQGTSQWLLDNASRIPMSNAACQSTADFLRKQWNQIGPAPISTRGKYTLQSIIVQSDSADSPYFTLYDRDLVEPSKWRHWEGNRPTKMSVTQSLDTSRDHNIDYGDYDLNDPENFATADDMLDFIACKICMSGDEVPKNQIVLCDQCDEGVHQTCQVPSITEKDLTYDPWYCAECWAAVRSERAGNSSVASTGVKRKFGENP
ncbi:hypothetical protein H4R33_001315 [Dimargaris cristalligena]|nr:hypothetical protein H4R33_001315 [Dimargaris cristalligena]